MSRAFSDIAFTPAVRDVQTHMGSRSKYEAFDRAVDRRDRLTPRETEFIEHADHFFQATVGETGWPYVQHRGGPAGFVKVLSPTTLGFADFRGNLQHVSTGNALGDDRASIIVVDYARRRRLKLLGRLRFLDLADADPELVRHAELPGYLARVERVALFEVAAFDWNCPQHITPRFTEGEFDAATQPLRDRIAELEARLAAAQPRA